MTLVFRNRMAAALWVFAALWWAFVVAMTYVLARDGLPAGYPPLMGTGIAALLWIFGIGFSLYVLGKPCFRVAVGNSGQVTVTWRYPHKVVRKVFAATSLRPAAVVESQDDEGIPYFHARIAIPESESFDVAEGHDRSRCQDACERFNLALKGHFEESAEPTSSIGRKEGAGPAEPT